MYTAVPAVVAGYPLLEALQACRRQAMAAEPGPGRAPFNRIAHSTRTWMHGDRDFNTPTVDLLYSNAWIDLRQGPVVLEIPARSRFFVVQLLDVHTENFFNLGTRNVPAGGARYALLPPGAPASLAPAGTQAVPCPSALVWLLGRVIVDGAMDLSAARAVQEGFVLHGTAVGSPFPCLGQWTDTGDAALDFFANLSRALQDFPPPAALRAPLEMLSGLLPPGASPSGLRPLVVDGLRGAWREAMALIEAHTHAASRAPWRFSTRLGRFGQDHMLRAATAWKGIGALAADEAIYAAADYDQHGDLLHGQHTFRIRFTDGGDLPADAFWSITLYGEDRFLPAVAPQRHALGSRSGLVKDADGSLSLHMGQRPPAGGPQSNWLPAPDAPFYLVLRLYHQQARLLEGRYAFPAVERLD